jgi:hypothetical protein
MRMEFTPTTRPHFFVNKFMVINKGNLQLETSVGKSDTVKSIIHLGQLQKLHNLRNLCKMHTSTFSVFCNVDSQVL